MQTTWSSSSYYILKSLHVTASTAVNQPMLAIVFSLLGSGLSINDVML